MEIKSKEIEIVPIGSLVPHPKNMNRHSDDQIDRLCKLVEYQGFRVPIVVQKGTNLIVSGHGRLLAAKKLGMETVPVVYQEFDSEAQLYAFMVSDNAIASWASLDLSQINSDIIELGPDLDIDLLGIKDFVLEPAEKFAPQSDPDEIPENVETRVKKGDVWLLGPHRLMCGDSTMFDDVKKLMKDEQASMIFTDPPWNISFGATQNSGLWGKEKRTIMNDSMPADKWKEFCDGFCAQLFVFSKPGCPIYLVMTAQEWPVIDLALRAAGFHWSSTIIWAKDRLVLSRKDYHTQYEPIWYGWNQDAARLHPVQDRKQTDLWQIDRPGISELHPTTKPVALVERAITNSCRPGDVVLDLFGGSGTTLIAAQSCGRVCSIMELDEKYASTILTRWEKFTGDVGKLEE